jgi:serine protease DegQ
MASPRRAVSVLALAVTLVAASGTARSQDEPRDELSDARERALAIEATLVDSLEKVRASSVSILIKKIPEPPKAKGDADPKPKKGEEPPTPAAEPQLVSCGSGVIVQRAGKPWVLTNHHVIDGGQIIEAVTFDGVTHRMDLHDTVPKYDIALLRFRDKPRGLRGVPVSKLAASKLEEGQWVLATGNPFFLATDGRSVSTLGVVSGLERVLDGRFRYGKAIQHDAEVNPGNSGGPLWNLRGELVGINGMIITRNRGLTPNNSGASFSIPMDQVASFLSRLVDKRKDAQAGYLGLRCVTHAGKKGVPAGARIDRIDRRSPAAFGGKSLQVGDVVESLTKGGTTHKIRTADDLTNALVLYPAGTQVRIRYRRGRKSRTWAGKLGQEPGK